MAAWLPLLKASIPYITQIVSTAVPAFTSKSAKGNLDDVIPKQIAELQAAATGNAEAVKTLATQLQEAINGIDAGAARLQQELVVLRRLSLLALVLSVLASAAIGWVILSKAAA